MGAEPYQYVVDYEDNIQNALNKLRKKVFESGEYFNSEMKPKTIEEAVKNGMDAGTRSILDINQVADEPDYECTVPFDDDELMDYFGTDKPSLEMVESNMDFWDSIERGMSRYIIVYENDKSSKIFFAGYSFD
jgi:hypothetical protein